MIGGPVAGAVITAVVVAGPDEPRPGLLPEDVTPGVIGFLVTLAVVLACIPLFRSMTRKVRGVAYRADLAEAEQVDDDPGRLATGAEHLVDASDASPDDLVRPDGEADAGDGDRVGE